MDKYKIEKNTVQETLIIPLYGRRLDVYKRQGKGCPAPGCGAFHRETAPAGHPPPYPARVQGQTAQQMADAFQALARTPGVHCHQNAFQGGVHTLSLIHI